MRLSVPRALLFALAGIAPAAFGAPAAPPDWPNVDPRVAPLVRGPLAQAAARLSTPGCASLLADLADVRTGRPLGETLARSGLNAGGWLRSLHVLPGDGRADCVPGRTLAFTPVGSRVVWVCPLALERLRRSQRSLVANVLVHESLHSLGLGENPPSSEEISLLVESRCGR